MKFLIIAALVFFLPGKINALRPDSKKNFTKQQLAECFRSKLAQKINTSEFNVVIERMPLEGLEEVPEEDLRIDDISIPSNQRSFNISIRSNGGDLVEVSGKIEWLSNIPVLLRAMGPSDIINISDVGYQTYPVDSLTSVVVMDANELIGKTPANSIVKPGLPIERSQLKNPTVVKKGELIDVVYRKNCLTVSAKALATQDLACGDTGIFETQHDSKQVKKISAKVVSPGTAEIIHGFA